MGEVLEVPRQAEVSRLGLRPFTPRLPQVQRHRATSSLGLQVLPCRTKQRRAAVASFTVNRTSGFHPGRLGVDSHTERALASREVSTAKYSRSAGVQMPTTPELTGASSHPCWPNLSSESDKRCPPYGRQLDGSRTLKLVGCFECMREKCQWCEISEYVASIVVSETRHLDATARAEVDRRITSAGIAQMGAAKCRGVRRQTCLPG
jgi:hypothetical protein